MCVENLLRGLCLDRDARRGRRGFVAELQRRRGTALGVDNDLGAARRGRVDIPVANRVVVAGRDQRLAVGRRQQSRDFVGVTVQATHRNRRLLARRFRQIPNQNLTATIARRQLSAVADERHRRDPIVLPRQHPGQRRILVGRCFVHGYTSTSRITFEWSGAIGIGRRPT
jgi:hypothetical protein